MEFIPKTQAIELKQLGFDEPCWAWYNIPDEDIRYCFSEQRSPITNGQEEWNAQIWGSKVENIGLPTSSQVFKWFRDEHNLHSEIRSYTAKFFTPVIQKLESIVTYVKYGGVNSTYATYEEAELACIDKLIEIVKQK